MARRKRMAVTRRQSASVGPVPVTGADLESERRWRRLVAREPEALEVTAPAAPLISPPTTAPAARRANASILFAVGSLCVLKK